MISKQETEQLANRIDLNVVIAVNPDVFLMLRYLAGDVVVVVVVTVA